MSMRVIVIGDVQGVGFRSRARSYAQRLGLSGYVRNLPHGGVEIVAQGEKNELEKLIEQLKADFGGEYQVTFSKTTEKISGFSISPD